MSLLHAARSRPRPQAGPPIRGCGISACRRCDDDSTAPRHFCDRSFQSTLSGELGTHDSLSFASPPFANKPYEYDDHGDEFYMLIDLLLLFPLHFSWPPFFAISNQIPIIASPMHALPPFFFFFLLLFTGAAKTRRIPLGGAEPQATNGLAQKRCVRPVHLRDRGLCLSLGFTKKERKTLACRAASDTEKREVGSWMGPLRD